MPRPMIRAAALSLALIAAAPTRADVNWRQFEGETLNAIYLTAAYIDAWFRPMAKQFEDETGIKVRMEVLQAGQARKKQDIMLAGQDSTLDLIMLQMDNRGGKLTAAGHLEDLKPYLDNPALTPADYDYPNDWLGGCLNTERVIEGQPLNNIVWSAQAQQLHIRTDLFKKYNVKVPTTMAELEAAAKALTIDEDKDGTPEIYGFLARGWGNLATASFATYLFNHGGSWFTTDASGKKVSNINSKESVDAFEFYGRMIRDYAPPSALSNKPPQNASLYAAGKTAMLSELNFWHFLADDPKKSKIAGNTTTILVPAGAGGSFPNVPTTSLAISKYSKKKDAAWLYIAWMTRKSIMLEGQKVAVPMCRRSVWVDPSYTAPTPAWGASARIAADYGVAIAKPQAIAIGQMRDAAAAVINVAIRDGSRAAIQAEADKQAAVMTKLVEETEQGMNFAGVIPKFAKRMSPEEQAEPIKAEGLDKLGM
ncbi:MAG: extracellular solute-binding protein [Ectothiorhodospiraceae bacterium]|nr:extracellular solute-binding protein [Chromatiales bacterium]MCP5156397.1 extracellular solute-binding protein [Ectothiorhodospiraceae bacterium]